jgi:hypothetical protein
MAKRFKINPEKLAKRRDRDYRGNDWNMDSGNYDCPSRRKKKTVLDDGAGYLKQSDINLYPVLQPWDAIGTSIIKIGAGVTYAVQILQCVEETTSELECVSVLLSLDRLGIYGNDVCTAYKNCNCNSVELVKAIDDVMSGDMAKCDLVG